MRDLHLIYTVYKTTNLKDNKIYIGMHKTNNLDDDYIGSMWITDGSIAKKILKSDLIPEGWRKGRK